jgi:hypothetical protein
VDPGAYFEALRGRLHGAGFKDESPPPGSTLMSRRRAIKLSRFGLVDTVVAVSTLRLRPDAAQLQVFAAEAVNSARAGKARLALGLGNSIVVYPVLVADAIPDELKQFVSSYEPKRWSIIEFPVVVDVSSGELAFYEKTPAWGAAYFRTTRREARDLLAPR